MLATHILVHTAHPDSIFTLKNVYFYDIVIYIRDISASKLFITPHVTYNEKKYKYVSLFSKSMSLKHSRPLISNTINIFLVFQSHKVLQMVLMI